MEARLADQTRVAAEKEKETVEYRNKYDKSRDEYLDYIKAELDQLKGKTT